MADNKSQMSHGKSFTCHSSIITHLSRLIPAQSTGQTCDDRKELIGIDRAPAQAPGLEARQPRNLTWR